MKTFLQKTRQAVLLVIGLSTAGLCARGHIVQFQCIPAYPNSEWEAPKLFAEIYDFPFVCGDKGMPSGPKITVGHSAGGNAAYLNAAKVPSEMVCATPCGYKHADTPPNMSMKEVPVFTITGDMDFGKLDVETSQAANAMGLREAVAWHMGHGHEWSNPDLVYLFWAQCIMLRYRPGSSSIVNVPREQGWLGDMDLVASWNTNCPYVASYSDYKRDKSKAAWLPTRYFAYCWRAFVPCEGRTFKTPMQVVSPVKTGNTTGNPVYNPGDSIPIKILSSGKGEDRLDILWGDNLIKSFPGNPYGVYSTVWKNPEPGFHGIVAVAYKNGVPIATSRLVVVIVRGKARYVPPAPMDNTPALPLGKSAPLVVRRQASTAFGISSLRAPGRFSTFSIDGRMVRGGTGLPEGGTPGVSAGVFILK